MPKYTTRQFVGVALLIISIVASLIVIMGALSLYRTDPVFVMVCSGILFLIYTPIGILCLIKDSLNKKVKRKDKTTIKSRSF